MAFFPYSHKQTHTHTHPPTQVIHADALQLDTLLCILHLSMEAPPTQVYQMGNYDNAPAGEWGAEDVRRVYGGFLGLPYHIQDQQMGGLSDVANLGDISVLRSCVLHRGPSVRDLGRARKIFFFTLQKKGYSFVYEPESQFILPDLVGKALGYTGGAFAVSCLEHQERGFTFSWGGKVDALVKQMTQMVREEEKEAFASAVNEGKSTVEAKGAANRVRKEMRETNRKLTLQRVLDEMLFFNLMLNKD